MRYRRRIVEVDAEQFDPDVKPWPSGVDAQPCNCAALAQDGRRCEVCKPNGRRYGLVRIGDIGSGNTRVVEIRRGDWIVTRPGTYYPQRDVLTRDNFLALYEAFPPQP